MRSESKRHPARTAVHIVAGLMVVLACATLLNAQAGVGIYPPSSIEHPCGCRRAHAHQLHYLCADGFHHPACPTGRRNSGLAGMRL